MAAYVYGEDVKENGQIQAGRSSIRKGRSSHPADRWSSQRGSGELSPLDATSGQGEARPVLFLSGEGGSLVGLHY